MPSSSLKPQCSVCSQPTSYWCSRCQQAWYCSAEHLQSDWPRHKKNCRPPSTAAHTFTISPTPNSVVPITAIHFSVSEEKPRLTTVNCMPPSDMSTGPCPIPILEPWFPDSRFASLTLTQGLNQEPLRFPLQVWYDSDALSRGSPVNRSVYRITSGQAARAWSGSVVVLKFSGSRRQGYSEASLNDLPALSAYFLGFA